MDFSGVAIDTAANTMVEVEYILSLNISPAEKRQNLRNIFLTHGRKFFMQLFNANSEVFDSVALRSNGFVDTDDQIGHLAAKLVQNYYLSREIDAIVREFYDSVLGKAQEEAFRNAVSLDKHPTLTRTMVGETCKWCQDRAGTHIYPESSLFARHDHCDCKFETSGYNTRNGKLKNYIKVDGRNRTIASLRAEGYTNTDIRMLSGGAIA